MKRFGLSLIACLVVALAFMPNASAQEPEPFNGLYGGFFSGYVGVDEDIADPIGSQNLSLDGWINGLTAGYNFRHDRFLFGIEVDGGILDAHDRDACPGGGTCEMDLNWLGTARARIGYIFGDEDAYALYVTGGVALVGIGIKSTLALTGPQHFHQTGYVIGGGGEAYLFDTNWISTKVEYQYIDFGSGSTYFTGSVTTADVKLDMHIVKVGLNIHY